MEPEVSIQITSNWSTPVEFSWERRALLPRPALKGVSLTSMTIRDSNLSCFRVEGCVFHSCTFESCSLESASFGRCEFIDCSFVDTNLSFATFAECSFTDCQFVRVKLRGASLLETDFGILPSDSLDVSTVRWTEGTKWPTWVTDSNLIPLSDDEIFRRMETGEPVP